MNDEGRLRIDTQMIGLDRRELHRRLAQLGLLLSVGLLAASIALVFAFDTAFPCLVGLFAPLLALASLGVLIVNALRGLPELGAGTLVVDAGKFSVDFGEGRAGWSSPISEITQGFREDPDRVHLAFHDGSVLIAGVRDPEARERLLRAVGVGAAERVLRVPLASAASQLFGGALLATIVLVASASALVLALFVVIAGLSDLRNGQAWISLRGVGAISVIVAGLSAATYALLAVVRRREVVVGADGLVFHRSFRRQRIPYAEVERVALDARGVQITLRGGELVSLPTSHALRFALPVEDIEAHPPRNEADARRRQLFARIREAMSLGGGEVAPSLTQLDRGDRSFAAWRKALRELATAVDDYRSRALSTEDLGAVIDDHGARAERRIAAAVALSAREPEEARRRVRIAAKACADEDLAAALEQAAEGEIAEALIEREAARRSADEPGR